MLTISGGTTISTKENGVVFLQGISYSLSASDNGIQAAFRHCQFDLSGDF
jgi:hypothetical protein